MLDENQIVMLSVGPRAKKRYVSMGYPEPIDGVMKVAVKDLTKSSDALVSVTCDICGESVSIGYEAYLKNIRKNGRFICRKCSVEHMLSSRHGSTLSQRRDDYMNRLLSVCNDKGYTILSKPEEICRNTSTVRYMCPVHGEHTMRLANLLNGRCCPDCATDARRSMYQLSREEIMKRVSECGGDLLNPDEYINLGVDNLKFRCSGRGQVFQSSLAHFLQHGGRVCKECAKTESLGERKVRGVLEKLHIPFEQEYWFPDCRDIKPLPFDFYLPSLNTIIEFDGRQHFVDTAHFTYSIDTVRRHDAIKEQYCADKGIDLIRIPYTAINHIEDIITEKLIHKDIV